jgi:tetratricopeptide (TPR) repeat protein
VLLALRGEVRDGLGQYEGARNDLLAAVAHYRGAGERAALTGALVLLGRVAWHTNDDPGAREALIEARELATELGDRRALSEAQRQLGNVLWRLGDIPASRAYFEEALALDRALGLRTGAATNLMNLGNIASYEGHYAQARSLLREALALNEQTGYRWGLAAVDTNLGFTSLALGDLVDAAGAFLRAMQVALAIGAAPIALEAMAGLSDVLASEGRSERAAELLGQCTSHPACDVEVQDKATPVRARLEASLGADALAAATARGAARTLEALVAELLAEASHARAA